MSLALGAVLFLAGVSVRLWGAHHLKQSGVTDFERIARPLRRARTGPYRWAKHPMYIGSVIMFAGAGMVFLGWGGVIIGYTIVPLLRERALLENEVLKDL